MADSFAAGEADSNTAGAPITQEVIGPRMKITVAQPGSGAQAHQTSEPYLMPTVAGRHGSMERVAASITQTPLGGLMPGPNAIAPAVMAGHVGAFPVSEGQFGQGVGDGYPEGCPVPIR
jgi:hypothetical protein